MSWFAIGLVLVSAVLTALNASADSSDHALPLAWHVEHDSTSTATMERAEGSIVLRYALGAQRPSNQFSALVGAIGGGLASYDAVTFTARADRAVRISVQLRPRGTDNPPRWQRSVYLDASPRTITVPFADLTPLPRGVSAAVPLASIDALMFVVDTNNTAPGTSGVLTVGEPLWRELH